MVVYDDAELETLHLDTETWRFEDTLAATLGIFDKTLPSSEQHVLREMFARIGNKSFMLHHAQGFEQFPLTRAYSAEEDSFIKTVQRVARTSFPANSNVLSSHVVYKLKFLDDQSLKIIARIAPYGKEDSSRDDMRSDCCMCPPLGIRVVLSTAALLKWRIIKIDVKSAFLQTGPAERQIYVIPPRESSHKHELWLFLTAAYGPVNDNAKWQV